ncbi:uncharacterized protein LOC115919375 [Strongylocentrotus purpuratus]|uniref:Uncharacterized protein n=1 Tax=Strongylocentrotus purpuratus TaxID=7668 RepID=A0A7M7SSY5_STRPU|nr:uncharacterized protein LOC115919375 [Strongylocentrotus purpuratus]
MRIGLLLIFVHQTSPNHTKMSSSNYSSDEISSRDSDSSYSDASLSHFSDSSQENEPDKCSKYSSPTRREMSLLSNDGTSTSGTGPRKQLKRNQKTQPAKVPRKKKSKSSKSESACVCEIH